MPSIRQLLAQRHLAVLICAAALLLKLLVPAGTMIGNAHGHLTVELCSGVAGQSMVGMHRGSTERGKPGDRGKAELPCAFSGLSAASLGAIDPIQLAALVAFIFAIALSPSALPGIVRPTHLRPPLRGPPATL